MKKLITAVLCLYLLCSCAASPTQNAEENFAAVEAEAAENIFLNADQERHMGSGGGYIMMISVGKAAARDACAEDYAAFLSDRVSLCFAEAYALRFDDGTGVLYYGCDPSNAIYGAMDYKGVILERFGSICPTDSGAYEYIPFYEEVDGLRLYPSWSDSKYLAEAVSDFPTEIFSTPAEENGLKGTVYISDAYIDGTTDFRAGVIARVAENEIAILDYGIHTDTKEAIYDLPRPETTVKVILTYAGFSEKLQLPVFYLGADEFCVEAMRR